MTFAGILPFPPALLAALSPPEGAAFFLLGLTWVGSLVWFAWSARGFLAEAFWRRLGLDGDDLE